MRTTGPPTVVTVKTCLSPGYITMVLPVSGVAEMENMQPLSKGYYRKYDDD